MGSEKSNCIVGNGRTNKRLHDGNECLDEDADTCQRPKHHRRRSSALKRFSVYASTEEYNMSIDNQFYGRYAEERGRLDYNYHSCYRKERQWLHDSIVDAILENGWSTTNSPKTTLPSSTFIPSENPWLLYTVGVKGAGKRHTIEKLILKKRLNLSSFVFVDKDEIRRLLPEYKSYIEKRPDQVGDLTMKECGYISEVLVLAALKSGRNVIWDCALQNAPWHESNCDKLRQVFPSLQVGLIHITAPLEDIVQRTEAHSKFTERFIPIQGIQGSINQIQASIQAFKPKVDYYCEIDNADDLHLLEGGSWDEFTSTFDQREHRDSKNQNRRQGAVSEVERKDSRRRLSLKRKRFSVLLSTEENHKSKHRNFYGQHARIRAKWIDYTYHSNYTYERQKFQDSVIADFLNTPVVTDKTSGKKGMTPTEPWIVFTAGAMGAGKSYTMNRLAETGHFPQEAFVNVDPDEIRRHLPEYHLYVDQSAELAGELTRKEAGFMSEILTLAALRAGRNAIVDGSLRDAIWYQSYFARLRKEFPKLRIAIIHITAPKEAVFQRAAERAIATGRVVPKDVLEAALEQVPRSVQILAPMVDFFAEINNAPDAPDVELVTKGLTWEIFESKWKQNCAWMPNMTDIMFPPKRLEDSFIEDRFTFGENLLVEVGSNFS